MPIGLSHWVLSSGGRNDMGPGAVVYHSLVGMQSALILELVRQAGVGPDNIVFGVERTNSWEFRMARMLDVRIWSFVVLKYELCVASMLNTV